MKSKFRDKRDSAKKTTTDQQTVSMAIPSKLSATDAQKDHPEQSYISGKSVMSDSNVYATDNLFSLLPQSSMLGIALADPMRLLTESHKSGGNDSILTRMKEIDGKLLQLQHNKTAIEEHILKLQKEKITVDHVTMQLQNERFLLLGSLLSGRSDTNLSHQPASIQNTFVPIASAPLASNNDARKISVVSPNSLNKRHDLLQSSTLKNVTDKDDIVATASNPVKRVLGIVDMTDDLSAFINRKRNRSTSQKTKSAHGKASAKQHRVEKPESIVDDHNYAESVDDLELNHESQSKRRKINAPIEVKQNKQNSGVNEKSTADIVEPSKKLQKNQSSKDATNHQLNSGIYTKTDNAYKSPTKLFDPKMADVVKSLSICLSPVKESATQVFDISGIEDKEIISSNVPEQLIKRQRGQRKTTNRQIARKSSPSKPVEFPVIEEHFSVKKCSVKLSRIKSSDYLLNFHGFEMSESAIIPNVDEFWNHNNKGQFTYTRDTNQGSKDECQYDGLLLGHKSPITFMKVNKITSNN